MITANGTVVDDNIPSPESYSVPLEECQPGGDRLTEESNPTFLTSKRFLSLVPSGAAIEIFAFDAGASVMSTSAMVKADRRRGGLKVGYAFAGQRKD